VIVGSGVDLCEVHRIQQAIARYGSRFVDRIYTEREIAYAQSKANLYERYAARFAAKESAPDGTAASAGAISRSSTYPPADPPSSSTAKPPNTRRGLGFRVFPSPLPTPRCRPWPL